MAGGGAIARPPITGACACGAVTYRAADRGFRPYACHCHGCQRRQGSAFALNQQVLVEDLAVRGETVSGSVIGLHGAQVVHHACPHCLTRLYTVNQSRPHIATIRTGTRDDSPALAPAFHVWTSRKQPWIVLAGDALCFETQPDAAEWMRLVLPEGIDGDPR